MRLKFKDLNRDWQRCVLATPLYADAKPCTLIIWCNDCGEWLPPKTRADRCDVCRKKLKRASGWLANCRNPACGKEIVGQRGRKYCCDACKEEHREAKWSEYREAALRMRAEEGLSLTAIADRLAVSSSTVWHALQKDDVHA